VTYDQESIKDLHKLEDMQPDLITRKMSLNRGILQALVTEEGLLECILMRVSLQNLLWLFHFKSPYSYLPSWIAMNNLRVEVHGDGLKTLLEGECLAPLQLQYLEIRGVWWNIPNSIL